MDWEEAKIHFYFMMKEYEKIPSGALALLIVFYPLAERYESGERTKELYEEMMNVG